MNRKTSGVIVFTLSLIFAIFILILSIKPIYTSIFNKEAMERYSNTDIIIQYDEYSPTRFINKRNLIETYEEIDFALSFFNLQVLSQFENETDYVTLFSSLPYELEVMLNQDIELDSDEIIVTQSLAKKYQLSLGDALTFSILDHDFTFIISQIINDEGILSGQSFFVDKSTLLEELFGLGSLTNLGNVIYIKTDNIDSLYLKLTQDSSYHSYAISLVQDPDKIQGMVDEYTSIILVAGILIILALFIVLDSLFLIVLKNIFKQISVFDTLGDSKHLGYRVCFYQWGYYIGISFLISLFLAHIVVAFGAYFYGVRSFVGINLWISLIGLLVISSYVLIRNLGYIYRYSQQPSLIKIKKAPFSSKYPRILNYSILALTVGILSFLIVRQPFSPDINSLFIVLLSVYVSIRLLVDSLRILFRFIPKKPTLFRYINMNHITQNPFIHESMRVIFIAFIVVTVLLSVRGYLVTQVSDLEDRFKVDILVTNLHQNDDSLLETLDHPAINSVSMGCFYNNVIIQMSDQSSLLRFLVSMNQSEYSQYFQYPLDDVPEEIKNHAMPYILLPKTYDMVYHIEVGDQIYMDLSPKLRHIPFVVGGFVDSEFDHFAYTNLSDKVIDNDYEYNTIFIDTLDSKSVISYLIDELSSDMMIVVDAQLLLEKQLDIADKVMALFTIITLFIVFSFLLVVFNNSSLKFDALKSDYAKIRVLGYDQHQLKHQINMEFCLVSIFIGAVGLIEIIILSHFMKYILLFFDYFKNLSAYPAAILISFGMVIGCLGLSYISYYRKLIHYPIVKEIKTF